MVLFGGQHPPQAGTTVVVQVDQRSEPCIKCPDFFCLFLRMFAICKLLTLDILMLQLILTLLLSILTRLPRLLSHFGSFFGLRNNFLWQRVLQDNFTVCNRILFAVVVNVLPFNFLKCCCFRERSGRQNCSSRRAFP